MSVFAKMKTDPRMKKSVKRAVVSTPDSQSRNEDFPGPDGDYRFIWSKMREWETAGTSYAVFEFTCTEEGEGDESCEGYVMSILIAFEDSAKMTLDDKLNQFMETLQLLGVDTPQLQEVDVIEKEAAKAVLERRDVLCSVVTSRDKKYKNVRIKELLEPSESEGEVVENTEEEEGSEVSSEEVTADNPHVDDTPSEWEGYQATVSDPEDDNLYWIANADDEGKTVDLTNDDEEVIYSYAPWDMVIPSAE